MTDRRIVPRVRERLAELVVGQGWRRVRSVRRIGATALATLALALALTPRPGSVGVPLVVVASDLAAGATIVASDLAIRDWPAELVPSGAVRDPAAAAGRVLVGAARAGEPLTDARLVVAGFPGSGPSATGGPDVAAVPVRLADAGVAALLVPGSRVDVVTLGERVDQPVLLAADAVVLAVLEQDPGGRGRLVMVALPRAIATQVAAASLTGQVAVTLR